MHMIGRGGAALRSVINYKVSGQSQGKIEHVSEFAGNVLEPMFPVNDREVMIDDRKGIEVDDVVLTKWESLLFRIEISRTQKAWPLGNGFCIHRCCRTSSTVGNVPDENVIPIHPNWACLCPG